MADDIYGEISNYSRSLWDPISVSVKNALVYMDDGAAEILHWSGRVLDLLDSGATAIQNLDTCGYGTKQDKKVVFVLSSFLQGKVVDKMQKILESCYFQHCSIFCAISENNHDLVLKKTANIEKENFFERFKEVVRFWMNNKYATVDIRHVPLVHVNVIPGLFILPSFSSFSPVLPSDLSVIQEWLKSKGDQCVFSSLSEVELHHMPQGFQVNVKLLASVLSEFFHGLNLTEDCYGMGHTSKLLASEVANLSSTRQNNTTAGRCTVIFVDRTLDIVQASSQSGSTLADKIFQLLPKHPGHNTDVMVDMSLCSSQKSEPSIVLPGSLAHNPSTPQTRKLLISMISKKTQDFLSDIHGELIKVLISESVAFNEDEQIGKVTAAKLLSLVEIFKNHLDLFIKHSALLQFAMAAVTSLQHEHNSHLQQLHGTEKVLELSLNEDDSPSCLSHILSLLENVRQGTRSYCFEDILLLLLHVYSLVGDECLDSEAEQNQLQEKITKDVLSGTLQVKTSLVLDMTNDSKIIIKSKISRCFLRLSELPHLRSGFTNFKDLFTTSSTVHEFRSYDPILRQIIGKVFDPAKAEIKDIEFKSTRLKDYIKSGFSLFMNVRKPHPSDYPVLFLFVIGGVTCTEVQCIMDHLTSHNIKAKVVIGATKILNSQDMLRNFFGQDNVFPNIDAL